MASMTKREVVLAALAFRLSHSVPPDVPPENLVAMMEELRAQNEEGRACT